MPTLDCPQLAFLLSSGEPLLLPNAYKAESQTVTALSALRDRNRVSRGHRDAQIASGSQTATLNDQQIEHLRVLTNDLYRSVDDGVELLLRSLKGITAYIDREFPEKTRLPVNWEAVQLSPPTGSGNSAEQ